MIRKYKETDADSVVDTWFESSSLAHPFLEAAFMENEKKNLRELYLPNSETWVYEDNGSVIGFVAMLGNEIGGLFVRPESHSKGIGTQLVNHVKAMHKELEVEVFEKNTIGRAFYDKYGFTFMKETMHEPTSEKVLRLVLK